MADTKKTDTETLDEFQNRLNAEGVVRDIVFREEHDNRCPCQDDYLTPRFDLARSRGENESGMPLSLDQLFMI